MSKTLKTYLAVIALVAVLAVFSYMTQRTNAPMPAPTAPQTDGSCETNPGGA